MLSDKFWMVVCLDEEYTDERGNYRIAKHHAPTFQWQTQEAAENEALRLAKKTMRQFAVFQFLSKTMPMPIAGEYKLVDVA